MSLVNKSSAVASLIGCAMALAVAAPAAAETIVVRASGPSASSYSPGKKLPDGGAITLKAGDVLTLLDGRGTRTLKGPGTFGTSVAAGASGGASYASFLGNRNTARARTGAVRSGAAVVAPRSPNLWYVDMTKAGAACIVDAANVKLWRPAATEAAQLDIAGAAGKASVEFAAGQAVAGWPAASLPVTEGASYTLSGAGLSKPVKLSFTLLDPGADGLEGTASTLIARKCEAQLDLLIDTVALPDADQPG